MKTILGLDAGFGAFKVYGENGGEQVVAHVAEAPSAEIDFAAVGMGGKPTATLITNGIGRFYVGMGAAELGRVNNRMDYDRLTGSPELKAIYLASLGKAGANSRDSISLVAGVPLGFVSGDGVKERVAQLKGWMAGEHHWEEGRKARGANVTSVAVLSQPHAAYLDYVLNDDGTENDNAVAGEMGIISIGHNTIELLVTEDGNPSRKFAHGEKAGVRRMLETINKELGGGYEIAELDSKLRVGKLNAEKAIATWGSEVASVIERAWGESHRRFAKVIAVGGGIRFVQPQLKKLFGSRLVVPEDAVMAIARGLYKFGVRP